MQAGDQSAFSLLCRAASGRGVGFLSLAADLLSSLLDLGYSRAYVRFQDLG